jgi:hypothetical protein
VEILQLPALRSILSGEYPATEPLSQPAILVTQPRSGPNRKRLPQQFLYCYRRLPNDSRDIVEVFFISWECVYRAVVQKRSLYILRLLSNGSICHNINYATGWTTEESGFDYQKLQEIVLLSTASRVYPGVTQTPFQRVPGAHSSAVKRPERESDISSSAESKNSFSNISTPPYVITVQCSETSRPLYKDRISFYVSD